MGRICIKKDATSYFLPATQKTLFRKYGDTVNLMKKYFSRRTSKSRNSSGKKFRYGRFFRNTGPGLKAEGMSRHVPYLSLIWTGQWLIVLHWCLIFYFNRFLFVISVYFIFFWQRSEYYLVSLHLLSQSALFRPISKPRRRHRKFSSWPEKFPFLD